MRFFRKAKKHAAWLAMVLQRDGIVAASIKRGEGKPAVMLASFFPGQAGPDALEKAAKDLHAANYRCSTVLGGGDYQIMAVEAPKVPPEERKAAMRFRLKDLLDFPVGDATFDLVEIPLDPNAAVRGPQSVFAVAASNGVVKARQTLFQQARLALDTIDIPEMAQRNVSSLIEAEGRGLAMLSFDEDGGLLTVSWRGELYLARRIDVTLAQLLDADHERKHAAFDKITLELQRSLDHFERQFSFIGVARLVLAPSGARGLEEYLSGQLYTRVETLDLGSLLDLAHVPELLAPSAQQRFFVAIGAALRDQEVAA